MPSDQPKEPPKNIEQLLTLSECAFAMREIATAIDKVVDGQMPAGRLTSTLETINVALTEYLKNCPREEEETPASERRSISTPAPAI